MHELIFADRGKYKLFGGNFFVNLLKKVKPTKIQAPKLNSGKLFFMKINLLKVSLCTYIKQYLIIQKKKMPIKRGYIASKSKSIKFDIRTCLFLGKKNLNINYACLAHELPNVFFMKRIRAFYKLLHFRDQALGY